MIKFILYLFVSLPCIAVFGCIHSPSYNRNRVYTDLNNEKKVQEIQRHLQQNETDTANRYHLVDIYLSEYFFEDAIAEIETIIRIDPKDIEAYELLALILIKSERTDYLEAANVLEKAARISPDRADIHANLALVYADLNRTESTILECHKALLLTNSPSQLASIYLILASVDKERAEEYYNKAAKIDPSISAADDTIITIPVYVGKKALFHFATHPKWKVRLKNLDSLGY